MEAKDTEQLLQEKDTEMRFRTYAGKFGIAVTAIAIIWSIFQLYAASFASFDAVTLRGWHVLFLLVMVYLLYPGTKRASLQVERTPIIDTVFVVISIVVFGYLLYNYEAIVLR